MFDAISTAAIEFPNIDPMAVRVDAFTLFGFTLGPFGIRWYSLGYIFGLLFAWWQLKRMAKAPGAPYAPGHVDDFFTWATIGVIAGGRLGYVVFYNLPKYLSSPIEIVYLWDGGMSFHGGLIGVVLSVILFCRRHNIDLMSFADRIAVTAPFGIMLVRIANFINAELWGRPTDVPWAMIFPTDVQALPRHPSQLYEAFGEGLLLLLVLMVLFHRTSLKDRLPGAIAGCFFIGYGLARFLVEFVREPDSHLGLMIGGFSRGQLLTIPMFLFAAWLIRQGLNRQAGRPVMGLRKISDLKQSVDDAKPKTRKAKG